MLSCFRCVQLFAILWTVACQAPLSMGFSRKGHWNGLPCSPPRDPPGAGIKPASPALQGVLCPWSRWEARVPSPLSPNPNICMNKPVCKSSPSCHLTASICENPNKDQPGDSSIPRSVNSNSKLPL